MLQKTATAQIHRVIQIDRPTSGVKVARSLKASGGVYPNGNPTIPEGMTFSPDYTYTLVRGVSARINNNLDGFPRHELLGQITDKTGTTHAAHNDHFGYRTFVGKHNHLDHHNTPALADGPTGDPLYHPRGTILAARYVEDTLTPQEIERSRMHGIEDPIVREAGVDAWVELLIANPKARWPKLCAAIERGEVNRVSMGTELISSECAACGNVARHEYEFCNHVLAHRGQPVPGGMTANSPYVRSGMYAVGSPVVGHERCHGLEFFEISWITDEQADPTALASEVIRHETPANASPQESPGDMALSPIVAAASRRAERSESPIVVRVAADDESDRRDRHEERRRERREEDSTAGGNDSEETDREESGSGEPGAGNEMDYSKTPAEQGGGTFYPDFPFPCSALRAASDANPDDPVDETINVTKCQGCMYNRAEEVGAVDCSHPEIAVEGGADPLPVGYAPVGQSTDDREGSGFRNSDGSEIKMLPGSGRRAEHRAGRTRRRDAGIRPRRRVESRLMKSADTPSIESLMERDDLYWRVHNDDAPEFAPENAKSALWGFYEFAEEVDCDECDGNGTNRSTLYDPNTGRTTSREYECDSCRGQGKVLSLDGDKASIGYSCMEEAEELFDYFDERGVDEDMARVVVFTGEYEGQGFDGEPLVIPDMDEVYWFGWSDLTRALDEDS